MKSQEFKSSKKQNRKRNNTHGTMKNIHAANNETKNREKKERRRRTAKERNARASKTEVKIVGVPSVRWHENTTLDASHINALINKHSRERTIS